MSSEITPERIIIFFFLLWSTRLPNHIPNPAVNTRKMPETIEVAVTDFVSRYIKKIIANQTVILVTLAITVLAKI